MFLLRQKKFHPAVVPVIVLKLPGFDLKYVSIGGFVQRNLPATYLTILTNISPVR